MIRVEAGKMKRFEPLTGEWREITNPVEQEAARAEQRQEVFQRRAGRAVASTHFPNG